MAGEEASQERKARKILGLVKEQHKYLAGAQNTFGVSCAKQLNRNFNAPLALYNILSSGVSWTHIMRTLSVVVAWA